MTIEEFIDIRTQKTTASRGVLEMHVALQPQLSALWQRLQ